MAAKLPVVLQDGTRSYVYGVDLISASDGAGNQAYFSDDGLGSTTDLTDGTGAVTDTYSYDVFGAVRARTGTSAHQWEFTGERPRGRGRGARALTPLRGAPTIVAGRARRGASGALYPQSAQAGLNARLRVWHLGTVSAQRC